MYPGSIHTVGQLAVYLAGCDPDQPLEIVETERNYDAWSLQPQKKLGELGRLRIDPLDCTTRVTIAVRGEMPDPSEVPPKCRGEVVHAVYHDEECPADKFSNMSNHGFYDRPCTFDEKADCDDVQFAGEPSAVPKQIMDAVAKSHEPPNDVGFCQICGVEWSASRHCTDCGAKVITEMSVWPSSYETAVFNVKAREDLASESSPPRPGPFCVDCRHEIPGLPPQHSSPVCSMCTVKRNAERMANREAPTCRVCDGPAAGGLTIGYCDSCAGKISDCLQNREFHFVDDAVAHLKAERAKLGRAVRAIVRSKPISTEMQLPAVVTFEDDVPTGVCPVCQDKPCELYLPGRVPVCSGCAIVTSIITTSVALPTVFREVDLLPDQVPPEQPQCTCPSLAAGHLPDCAWKAAR